MNLLKRITAVCLGCILLSASALADGFGLDASTSAWLGAETDVRFALSVQFETLDPYGESTVDMMNALLKHMSVTAETDVQKTALALNVAGDPVIELTEKTVENGTELTTGLLPNRVLTSRGSAIDAFTALPSGASGPSFDFFAAVDALEGCYQQLTDAIVPYAEEKKANYTIKNVASSKWSRIARLTPEQSTEIAPLIAQVLGCGMDEKFQKQLLSATYGKGFIVGLYQTKEDGDDLAVYIKGDMTFSDGAKRTLSYQWAFATKENGERVDTFKFEMKKAKAPKDDRIISASYKRTAAEDAMKLKGESSARITDPDLGQTVTTTLAHDLSGKREGDVRKVSGNLSRAVRTAAGEKAQTITTTVKPDVQLLSMEGSTVLSGTAQVEKKTGKEVTLSAALSFDEEPAELLTSGAVYIVTQDMMPPSSLTQNLETDEPDDYLVGKPPIGYTAHPAPENRTTVDLDAEDGMDSLMDELSQNLAGKLLIALSKLPEEDTALLRDAMSEADYAAFMALVEGL